MVGVPGHSSECCAGGDLCVTRGVALPLRGAGGPRAHREPGGHERTRRALPLGHLPPLRPHRAQVGGRGRLAGWPGLIRFAAERAGTVVAEGS